MYALGRTFLLIGIVLLIVGAVLMLLARFNISLGRLPGDVRIERDGFTCLFPLASSLLISVVLSLLLNLALRLWRR
ncbi:MAG: hypothetical protein Fur0018_18270 [Anaerolineales bacterium]